MEQTHPHTVGVCKGFLLSAEDVSTRPFFDGYFFNDTDFILGEEGAEQFRVDNGSIQVGKDGCYVVGDATDDSFQIGTDFSGNYRLFLYRDQDYWAVSNSVTALAEAAKRSDRRLTLNHAQLQAWRFRGPFCNQLSSFRTVINEIELVPSDKSLLIAGEKLHVVDRPRVRLETVCSYKECLGTFLTTWLARLKGLLHHEPFRLSVDLSGGLDSRLVFALFAHLEKNFNEDIFSSYRSRINTNEEPHMRADFETARQVLEALGITHWESGREAKAKLDSFTGHGASVPARTAFEHWRANSMAQYSPFRTIPARPADLSSVKFGGAGGEEYRPFYKKASVHDQALQYRSDFDSESAFSEWYKAIDDSVEYLTQRQGTEVDPLLLHYREFRSRFHSGSRAMVSISVFPLKSSLLRNAASRAGPSALANRQLLFDILHSLEPTLLHVAFDDKGKSPTDENLRALTTGSIGTLEQGRIYASRNCTDDGQDASSDPDSTPFDVMEQIVTSSEHEIPRNVVSRRLLKRVKRDITRGKRKSGFVLQKESVDLHYVLLVIELLTLRVLTSQPAGWRQRFRRAFAFKRRR